MEWAAIDTLVKLTKRNVDAAHTSWKQLGTAAVDTSVANTISNVDALH